jgi:hypothetical protein
MLNRFRNTIPMYRIWKEHDEQAGKRSWHCKKEKIGV